MLSVRNSIKLGITKNQWPFPDISHELTLHMQATILVHLGPASGEPGIVKGKMKHVPIVISEFRVIKNFVFFLIGILGQWHVLDKNSS